MALVPKNVKKAQAIGMGQPVHGTRPELTFRLELPYVYRSRSLWAISHVRENHMPAKKAKRAKKSHKMAAPKKLGKVKSLTLTANTISLTSVTTAPLNPSTVKIDPTTTPTTNQIGGTTASDDWSAPGS